MNETTPTQRCAVGPCAEPRLEGGQFCAKHARADSAYQGGPAGPANSALICPHCQVRGQVRTRRVKQKKGVSGAKLTGAVFTAGFSIIGTGLSRKEKHREMTCGNCGTVWVV
jgi:hypothetical protein